MSSCGHCRCIEVEGVHIIGEVDVTLHVHLYTGARKSVQTRTAKMALGDQLSSIIGMRQYLHTRTIHARVHVHTAGSLYILTHIRKHQYQDSNQVDA